MIDLALAKQHLRILNNEEDALITSYLAAAVAWVEQHTGKLLTRREVTQVERSFASLRLFYGPDPDLTSIAYTDADEADQVIADARLVRDMVYPASTWPSFYENTPITLAYTAGFTDTPADLDNAVLLLVGHWFANREAVNVGNIVAEVPMGVEALCRAYRELRV